MRRSAGRQKRPFLPEVASPQSMRHDTLAQWKDSGVARGENSNQTSASVSTSGRPFETTAPRPSNDDVVGKGEGPIRDSNQDGPLPLEVGSTGRALGVLGELRWWCAVAVGAVLALPIAWILSYVAALPFFLGLFFFPLLGLVIGACMHRIAAPARPYGRGSLLLGTTLVVLLAWGGSIVKESRDFPHDIASRVVRATRRSIDDVHAFRATLANDVRRAVRERYPPGGALGYVRWILADGTLEKGQIPGFEIPITRTPHGWAWAIRVVLSAGLLAFGIGSQTLPLHSTSEHRVRAIDERKGS